MRRTVVSVISAIVLGAGAVAAAAPAQASSWGCDRHRVPGGWSAHCWGPATTDYRVGVYCQRADSPRETYWTYGPWRNMNGPYASVATCGSDYFADGYRLDMR